MKNSKVIISCIGIILIAIVCGWSYKDTTEKKVAFNSSFDIYKLTDEEYKEVGTSELDRPTKEDFRKAVLKVEMAHTSQIKNREITVPTLSELKAAINSYDKERYWFGHTSEEDNSSANTAAYVYEFVFYSKDLSEHNIKELFSHLKISASWLDAYEKEQEESDLLSDMIHFVN